MAAPPRHAASASTAGITANSSRFGERPVPHHEPNIARQYAGTDCRLIIVIAQIARWAADLITVTRLLTGIRSISRTANRRAAVGVAVLLVAAAVAGCSTSTPAPIVVPTVNIPQGFTGTGPGQSKAERQLQRVVLTRRDVPRSWATTPHQDDTDATQPNPIARCGLDIPIRDIVANADSADYARGTAKITSSATRYTSERDVRGDVADLHRRGFLTCFRRTFHRGLREQVPPDIELRAFHMTYQQRRPSAPRNVVGTFIIRVTAASTLRQLTMRAALVLITGPRLEAMVMTQCLDTCVPARSLDKMTAAVARRAVRA
jgi:hypothetical protein